MKRFKICHTFNIRKPMLFFHYSFHGTFFPNEWPDPCRHRPGHSLGKEIKYHEMNNEKTTWVFLCQTYGKF